MFTKRIVSKVPGETLAESKKEKQGYIGDLSVKSTSQLKEILDRQLKLLENRAFINKLADKGEKVTKLKEHVEGELKKRNKADNLSSLLSVLSLKEDIDKLEWTGRCAPGCLENKEETELSDEEEDPFKILASHSGAGFHKKKLRVLKPEESLISPLDIKKCTTDKKEPEEDTLEEYAKHLCDKIDLLKKDCTSSKFMPNKTLKKSLTTSNRVKSCSDHWEITAATPPPPIHGDSKLVSLQESIKLQCEQQQKLKEIQIKHAAERLASSQHLAERQLPTTLGSYRDPGSVKSSDDENSDNEVHDEDDYPDNGGVVVFNLVDDLNDN